MSTIHQRHNSPSEWNQTLILSVSGYTVFHIIDNLRQYGLWTACYYYLECEQTSCESTTWINDRTTNCSYKNKNNVKLRACKHGLLELSTTAGQGRINNMTTLQTRACPLVLPIFLNETWHRTLPELLNRTCNMKQIPSLIFKITPKYRMIC